ncbi:MAG: hypothetical protein QM775_31775 [Pirellulales bacterium]
MKAPADLLASARQSLAVSQYYTTWLMRLEGEPPEIWEPEIESARQIHRLLAEQTEREGGASSSDAAEHRENVEATIRLARMDLDELQALKLPSQCCNCKGGACKKASKKPGQKPKPQANEPKDARGASLGPPPDDGGN